jgi:hypothetical protein
LCAVFVPVHAQSTDESARKSELSVTLGLGGVSGGAENRSIFNQYNILGLNGANCLWHSTGF